MMRQETIDRILNRYHLEGTCWIWDGSVLENGYGQIRAGKKAHRFFYEHYKGSIPEGLELDHTCSNKLCVNPDHLQAITHRMNTLLGNGPSAENFLKTKCKNGHDLSLENTRVDDKGMRQCVICSRKRWRESKERCPQIR